MAALGALHWLGTPAACAEVPVELAPFTVMADRAAPHPYAAMARLALTAPELQRMATRSFADAIEMLPGIRVENNCQNCGTADLLMLGLSGHYTQLLFDGLPLHSGLAGVYGLDQIPALFIDRIEVRKGSGAAQHGGEAIGGTVNIIGHQPVQSGRLSEYRHDSIKGRAARQLGARLDHVSADRLTTLSVYGQAAAHDPVDLNGDGFSELTKRELQVLGARWTRYFSSGTLRVDGNRTTEYRRGGDLFEVPGHLANIAEQVDTTRASGAILWRATPAADFNYHVHAGFVRIDRQSYYGGLFGQAAAAPLRPESSAGAGDHEQALIDRGYRTTGEVARDQYGFTDNLVVGAEALLQYRGIRHQFSCGLQYRHEKVGDQVPVSPFVDGYPAARESAAGSVLAAFMQDDWQLGGRWRLLLGLRAERHSVLRKVRVLPRLDISHGQDSNLTWRARFGAGIRPPQLFDEDLHVELIAGERATTRQAAGLRAERAHGGMLGAVWSPEFAHGRLTIDANVFGTVIRDTFTLSELRDDPQTGERVRERSNGPDAAIGGIDLSIGWLPRDGLRVDLGHVTQFARYAAPVRLFAGADGRVVAARDFLETPRHYSVARATLTGNPVADIALSVIHTGAMQAFNERTGVLNARTESFMVFNLVLTRAFALRSASTLTLSLGVNNLTDARQRDLESGVDRDPYYFYGPRTPRSFFMIARLAF
jgi:outer membrane receptor for ferrienterochelin and colicins